MPIQSGPKKGWNPHCSFGHFIFCEDCGLKVTAIVLDNGKSGWTDIQNKPRINLPANILTKPKKNVTVKSLESQIDELVKKEAKLMKGNENNV